MGEVERDGVRDALLGGEREHEEEQQERTKLQNATAATNWRQAVYLNIYDLETQSDDPQAISRWNSYLYYTGLGLYHSGVEVYDKEYAFGGSALPSTGVFVVEPRNAPCAKFRQQVFMGYTELAPDALHEFVMGDVAAGFAGNSYNLLKRNCNHFADALCQMLTGRAAPVWVNRLAWLGTQMKCVLPTGFDDPFGAAADAAASTSSATAAIGASNERADACHHDDDSRRLLECAPAESRSDRHRDTQLNLAIPTAETAAAAGGSGGGFGVGVASERSVDDAKESRTR
uniref:PPPDE domain-containing protein n=1 Tax=Erythrolobus madagascarensis TaxID=708628 RepID=A0A7S0T6M0_9RHOD|mmetsp:Transcript_1013/g.1978  ORF Transcript_1013/g.1978 Transcript_1013/m.1978 type:complete len:287 (+) Transcript_1013:2-862(+)